MHRSNDCAPQLLLDRATAYRLNSVTPLAFTTILSAARQLKDTLTAAAEPEYSH
ncbi:hypothetical protein [Burkholderia contaminans]|uniref:hypothetical protein n=1 Tax=Burkholderia contaminans TaxID=488447 RepID=UPI001581F3D6|nr:hypothetical protein [Burkholderia contaminans]